MSTRQIILASASPARREMLTRAGLRFTCEVSGIDETPLPNESAPALVVRLARSKAQAVAARFPEALVIGSDQVLQHGEQILGKPGTHEAAVQQLRRMSGARITLHAGLALYDAADDGVQTAVEPYHVAFRELDDALIERYLRAEQPYSCCGSLKAEGRGIALLKSMRGDDPNTLLGMPLIRLIDMLHAKGVEVV